MIVLCCKKLPRSWEIFLFIREMNEPGLLAYGAWQFEAKLFTTNYNNRVVHVFKVVF